MESDIVIIPAFQRLKQEDQDLEACLQNMRKRIMCVLVILVPVKWRQMASHFSLIGELQVKERQHS